MIRFDKVEDPRRRLLIEALALAALTGVPLYAGAQIFGSRPQKMPPDRSIFRIVGTATVNGVPATLETFIRPGDTVQTGPASEIIFVVGGHSMMMRADSTITIEGDPKLPTGMVVTALRMLTGKLLTVSRNTSTRVTTTTATIGIRGTGYYTEADPDQTYFCTCYGVTEIEAIDDPTSRETVAAKQHDRPVYIVRDAPEGQRIRNAPFINHTDQELTVIETLVGRMPPFVFPKDEYKGPRREY